MSQNTQNTEKEFKITESQLNAIIKMLTQATHPNHSFEVIAQNIRTIKNLPELQNQKEKTNAANQSQ